ncbi:MAG: response regulator [Sediminicola sp.]|tara:strand:+ start:13302 stop:13736 length:435 start_codon:yes stop_codon:yes gene_type:complete
MNILLVEDNEGDILLTQEALFEADPNCEVSIVRDGDSGLDFVFKRGRYKNEVTPDLILLDINLPKKNGHEVLKILKTSEEFRMVPVVFLTTSSDRKDITLGYANGVNCYVTKDFILEDLTEIVYQIAYFWSSVASLPSGMNELD